MTMNRIGVHKGWGLRFLLNEIEKRVVFDSDRVDEMTKLDRSLVDSIKSYLANAGKNAVSATLSADSTGLRLMRVAEHQIYRFGTPDCHLLWLGQNFRIRDAQFGLYRLLCQIKSGASINTAILTFRRCLECMSASYALGWVQTGRIIGDNALKVLAAGAMSDANPFDRRTREHPRRCFAWFAMKLHCDFAGKPLPDPMPNHPFPSPAYDALLSCWRSPDPASLLPALLAVCDWHTHECMYSRSDRNDKFVDFLDDTLMGWPLEVHMVFRLREQLGLAVPQKIDHPLMQAPLGAYMPPQPVVSDRLLSGLTSKLVLDFPDFAPLLGETARVDVLLEDVPL